MKTATCLILFLAAYPMTTVALGKVTAAEEPAGKVESFTYKKTKQADLSLHVHFPPDWKKDDQRPAIVFFFGGGWTSGNIAQFETQAAHFARRGMVAVRADYRVKSRHEVTPDACVEDAKSAIRWVRKNAGKLGVDSQKIVGSGGSAGGHLAASTALCPGLDAKEEDASISSRPNALVLFNSVLHFNAPSLTARLGNDEKLAKAISPTLYLAKDSVPAILFFGKEDRLLEQGEEFMARSKTVGHRGEMMLAEGVGHGFFNREPWKERTLARADAFLVSLGYLQPRD